MTAPVDVLAVQEQTDARPLSGQDEIDISAYAEAYAATYCSDFEDAFNAALRAVGGAE